MVCKLHCGVLHGIKPAVCVHLKLVRLLDYNFLTIIHLDRMFFLFVCDSGKTAINMRLQL